MLIPLSRQCSLRHSYGLYVVDIHLQVFATVGGDNFVRVWGMLERELIALVNLNSVGCAVDWSSDGRTVAGIVTCWLRDLSKLTSFPVQWGRTRAT